MKKGRLRFTYFPGGTNMKKGHNNIVRRGDIYLADLNPVRGSEQGGIRPVLILQNNVGNRYSPTVIVAAITRRTGKHNMPTHVPVGRINGLHRDSLILLEQVRTIDRSRLLEYINTLPSTEIAAAEAALEISFGLSPEYK